VPDLHPIQAAIPERLQQFIRLTADIQLCLIQCTDLRDKVKSPLPLLLLQFEGNTTHRSLGDTTHKMGGESGNFVAHAFGGGDSNFVNYAFIGVKVEC